jgi:diaminopimelate epimerase
MSGAGNRFSVVDNRTYQLSLEQGKLLAPLLCAPQPLLGSQPTEGMMLVAPTSADESVSALSLDFTMHFFNPDGSYGAMCGNGGRCAAHFAALHGITNNTTAKNSSIPERALQFSSMGTAYTAEIITPKPSATPEASDSHAGSSQPSEVHVRLYFPPPREMVYPFGLTLPNGLHLTIGYVDVGSDHAVVWFNELGSQMTHLLQQHSIESQTTLPQGFDTFDIHYWGALIRHYNGYPQEVQRGANASFYTVLGRNCVRIRTFERGVEAETGACGTGAIATAMTAILRHNLVPPITVIPPSGSPLVIDLLPSIDDVERITLTGSSVLLGEAVVDVEL